MYETIGGTLHDATTEEMNPTILVRAWTHVWCARYQSVCCSGKDGEVAFWEPLVPQFTSPRHDSKGLRSNHVGSYVGGGGPAANSPILCMHSCCVKHGLPAGKEGILRNTCGERKAEGLRPYRPSFYLGINRTSTSDVSLCWLTPHDILRRKQSQNGLIASAKHHAPSGI